MQLRPSRWHLDGHGSNGRETAPPRIPPPSSQQQQQQSQQPQQPQQPQNQHQQQPQNQQRQQTAPLGPMIGPGPPQGTRPILSISLLQNPIIMRGTTRNSTGAVLRGNLILSTGQSIKINALAIRLRGVQMLINDHSFELSKEERRKFLTETRHFITSPSSSSSSSAAAATTTSGSTALTGGATMFDEHQVQHQQVELPPGTYTYPFEFHLPGTCPETISVSKGSVHYTLRATLTRPAFFRKNLVATEEVVVLRYTDDMVRLLSQLKEVSKRKILVPGMYMRATVAQSAYGPGENIHVTVQFIGMNDEYMQRIISTNAQNAQNAQNARNTNGQQSTPVIEATTGGDNQATEPTTSPTIRYALNGNDTSASNGAATWHHASEGTSPGSPPTAAVYSATTAASRRLSADTTGSGGVGNGGMGCSTKSIRSYKLRVHLMQHVAYRTEHHLAGRGGDDDYLFWTSSVLATAELPNVSIPVGHTPQQTSLNVGYEEIRCVLKVPDNVQNDTVSEGINVRHKVVIVAIDAKSGILIGTIAAASLALANQSSTSLSTLSTPLLYQQYQHYLPHQQQQHSSSGSQFSLPNATPADNSLYRSTSPRPPSSMYGRPGATTPTSSYTRHSVNLGILGSGKIIKASSSIWRDLFSNPQETELNVPVTIMPASLISQIAFPPVFDEPDPAANGHHANGATAISAAATVATAITTAQETNGVHPVASLPSLADALMSVPRPPSLEPLSMPEPMYIDQPSDQHAISSLANSIMGDDDTAMADDSETTSSHMTQPERSNYLSHAMDILRR